MGSCYTCIRYLMFAFNFIFWLLGAGIFGVSLWILVKGGLSSNYVNDDDQANLLNTVTYVYIVFGIFITATGFIGCCGTIKESEWIVATYFSMLFVIAIIFLGAGIWSVIVKEQAVLVKEAVDNSLDTAVRQYFDSATSRDLMDTIQETFKCCGASKGALDYPFERLHLVKACAKYTQPCTSVMHEFVDQNLIILIAVSFAIAAFTLLGMVLSMIMCCELRDARIP